MTPDEELDALLAGDDEEDAEPVSPPEAEMTVGTPEVIRSERPLGRTLNMDEVQAEAGPAWMRGLSDESREALARANDSISATNPFFTPYSSEETVPSVEQSMRGLSTGFANGYTAGAPQSASKVASAMGFEGGEAALEPFREAEAASVEETPRLHALGDVFGSWFSPANKIKLVKEGGGFVANLLNQAGLGGLEGFMRSYGDTGDARQAVSDAGKTAAISALASAPTAAIGAVGSKLRAKAENPRNQALRADEYNAERLRSAGVSSGQIDNLPPEKLGEVVALIEDMTARSGRPPTVPELGYELQKYVESHRGSKDAAFAALAEQGATVSTNDMAGALRAQKDQFSSDPSVRESARARATLEDMASGYDAKPATAIAYDEYTPVEAYPEVAYPQPQAAQPPPLPAPAPAPTRQQLAAAAFVNPQAAPAHGAMSPRSSSGPVPAQAMPAAPPARPSARAQSQVMDIAPEDLTPVRPSARAQPQPPPQPDVLPVPPSDPIGALAAQRQAPPPPDDIALLMEQDMQPHLEETPGLMSPDQLIEADIAAELERAQMGGPPAPRPSARYRPPPSDVGHLMGNEVVGSGRPSARYQPPPPQPPAPPPPDPVGALAAMGGPANMNNGGSPVPPPEYQAAWSGQQPWTAADQAAQPPMAGAPPPLPGPPPEEFVRGVPMDPEVISVPRAGVPIKEWNPERKLIGQAAGNSFTPPEAANQFRDPQYAASVDAMRTGMLQVDPELAHQWDANNYSEGLGTLVQDEAQKSRHLQTPGPLDYSSNKAAWIGGSVGAGIGSMVMPGFGTGVGAAIGGAVGKGIGYAANRYMEPRAHAIKANWLQDTPGRGMDFEAPSGDFGGGYSGGSIGNRGSGWLSGTTLEKAQRLERVGSFPVGSLTASFGDLMRDPPAEQGESDPNGPTSSLDPGSFLGRNTTNAMLAEPEAFKPYADDYAMAGTDDRRAAVTERLYRTDPKFARNVFPRIGGGESA